MAIRLTKPKEKSEETAVNMNGAFRFHNVGQGLFYSGMLSKKSKSSRSVFSFVYDCGTDSHASFLERETDDYKLLLPPPKRASGTSNKRLNLLVISHLHDDHVNGLKYLLKDMEADTVVMPYANDDLKLLARLESHSEDEFLQIFYADPVAWLSSKGVRRILLIGAEEPTKRQENSLPDQRQYTENPDLHVDPQSILKTDRLDKTEIVYLKNRSRVSVRSFDWEFHFENLKLSSADSYMQIVKEFKQKENLTSEQILKNKSLLDDLRRQLKAEFPNGNALNRTSVVLLHGPTRMPDIVDFGNLCCSKYSRAYIAATTLFNIDTIPYSGTVLTGDIELKNNECLEMLTPLSGRHHKDCLLAQYPHHGSKNNNISYFTDLHARVYVLSYGIANKHGHPHGEVLQELPYIAYVNERNSFDYQIIMKDS